MRIFCLVADIHFNKYGGAEMHFVEVLKRNLLKLEKAVVLVGPDDSIKSEFANFKNIEIISVNYPHVINLHGFIYIFYALIKAFQIFRKEKFDLIWAKQEYPQAVVGAILKTLFKTPLYITCQNPLMHKEELVASNFIVEKFKNFLTPVISWSFSKADVVACVSRFSEINAKKMGAKNTVVIPNGVDIKKYA